MTTKLTRTFILIKPDGVQRGLIGEIITRFEKKGFHLEASAFKLESIATVKRHYAEHDGKSFFDDLVHSLAGHNVMCMIWRGPDIVSQARTMIGDSVPSKRLPGTIRHDLSCNLQQNVVHGSDSDEAAEREIAIWFPEGQ